MVKFSIIIPVFNAYETLESCLDSILKQTFSNYEVILVNDGSTDDSEKIMDKFLKKDKRFKKINKENSGVADARNDGIKLATGDFFIFVDSDDTINEQLLEKLNAEIENNSNLDLIKYQIQVVKENNIFKHVTKIFSNLKGEEAFVKLINDDLFVTPVTYAYRLSYFKEKNFLYATGRIHEDFGLTPLVVVKAEHVSAIDYIGYNYIIRENSIMTDNSIEKLKKKNADTLFHYDYLISEIDKSDINEETKKIFKSYISNGMINRTVLLDGELLKEYLQELKRRKMGKNLLANSFFRKLKKIMFNSFPNIYVKLFVR